MISKYYPEFVTVTCLNWIPVLQAKEHKVIILESFRFLVKEGRVKVSGFVLMNTHFHFIWHVMGDHRREDVQQDFLRFTSQQILKKLRNSNSPILKELLVEAKDRRYQVWERNSLSIEIHKPKTMIQELDYIHFNPVEASLCQIHEEYEYSSALFYKKDVLKFEFLSHYQD